jgi:endo-1,4-beta-xylanase
MAPGAGSSAACLRVPDDCSLREIADERGVLVGTAVAAGPLRDLESYRAVIAREFNSVTPENQAKWAAIEPARGAADFGPLDDLVEFAAAHDLKVRGHTLVWGQAGANGVPDWVAAIRDPDALRTAVSEHIRTEVARYRGRIDRWDVVNEPLESHGAALDPNLFLRVLGPDYIDMAFAAAHAADPQARLWLNENVFERLTAKSDALVQLVARLVGAGVPITGVGLQAHFLSGRPPAPGVIEKLVRRLRAVGVEVAITELDLPVPARRGAVSQPAGYAQVVAECLRAGCREITVWGVNDAVTWLDAFLRRAHTDPLLFDAADRPKPAYGAFKRALASTPATLSTR